MKQHENIGHDGHPAVRENTGMVGFSDLAEGRISRARAIKLAGAMLGTGAFALLLPDEADARRKKKRRRRRRRKAQVAPTTPTPLPLVPNVNTIQITNPSGDPLNPSDKPLTISGVKLIGEDGSVISTQPLVGGPVTIEAGETGDVVFDLSGLSVADLADADSLRLIDEMGVPITIVDENGVQVGVGDIDVL